MDARGPQVFLGLVGFAFSGAKVSGEVSWLDTKLLIITPLRYVEAAKRAQIIALELLRKTAVFQATKASGWSLKRVLRGLCTDGR
jgi:hypothetical protein